MDEVKYIRSDLIDEPKMAMRTDMDRDALDELAQSIKQTGLINPITIRRKGERYEVVAGHRRLAACRIAGVVDISCVIKDLSDEAVFNIMAQENLFRADVDPVDEAIFIGKLLNEMNLTIDQIAEKTNRSIAWVEDRLDILDYPKYMIVPIKQGRLKLGVAKNLGAIKNEVIKKMYIDQAVNYGMSVRQAEYIKAQDDMGLLEGEAVSVPDQADLPANEPPAARAVCAKCGEIAVSPNLKNVFIHVKCPCDE